MLRIRTRQCRDDARYWISSEGNIMGGNHRTLLRPVKVRMYGGMVATAYFNDTARTEKILQNAGFEPERA